MELSRPHQYSNFFKVLIKSVYVLNAISLFLSTELHCIPVFMCFIFYQFCTSAFPPIFIGIRYTLPHRHSQSILNSYLTPKDQVANNYCATLKNGIAPPNTVCGNCPFHRFAFSSSIRF